jgi:p-cumate 2,3-dioxygenase subunit beta
MLARFAGNAGQELNPIVESRPGIAAVSPLPTRESPASAHEETEMDRIELPSRSEVEDLFYKEAALLDQWRLEEWLAMLTEDAVYQIPPTDVPEGNPRNTLYLIADDAFRIRSRVKQLLGKSAWSENPHSRTRRIISNVRVLRSESDEILATANFAIYRMRYELVDVYVGRYDYKLVRIDDQLRIRERRAILDNESLRPQGKISFIL